MGKKLYQFERSSVFKTNPKMLQPLKDKNDKH